MPEKANILLVDDRDDQLTTLEAILTSLNQNLVRANSGEAALKALLEREFAVILMDVMMPGMDGFETASHVKQRERTKDIPIIFLSGAEIDRHQVFRGYSSQSIDYLTKPVDPWVLRAKVEVFIEMYQLKQRLHEQGRLLRERLSEAAGVEGAESLLRDLVGQVSAVADQTALLRERIGEDAEEDTLSALRGLTGAVAELSELAYGLQGTR